MSLICKICCSPVQQFCAKYFIKPGKVGLGVVVFVGVGVTGDLVGVKVGVSVGVKVGVKVGVCVGVLVNVGVCVGV
jgi:hypothetical protein